MAWLARSIANSLKFDDEIEETTTTTTTTTNNATDSKSMQKTDQSHDINSSSPRGVKEDLSELTKTLKTQFWGVASFLAPPPPSDQSDKHPPSDPEIPDEAVISGIRSDFAEISGKFKTGISKLSSNIAVSEITKMASNFLQIGSEEYEVGSAVGVTEEVLAFAKNIALHPETWLDFPVPDEDDFDDFDLSDAQQEHALAVERLAPSLAALRIELCPGHMSEGCFWKIYFVLLHPRLNKQDAELLSTPQIVEARALLMQELQNQANAKPEPDQSGNGFSHSKESSDLSREEYLSVPTYAQSKSAPLKTSDIEAVPSTVATDIETEKHPVQSTEMQVIDKSVVKEEPVNQTKHQPSPAGSSNVLDEKFEDDADDWLKEESSEIVGVSGTSVPFGNDEDVSFSDLEEEDGDVPTSHKKTTSGSDSSTKDSPDWVQLSRSSTDSVKDINTVGAKHAGSDQVSARNPETKETNDWLDVDDIDVM